MHVDIKKIGIICMYVSVAVNILRDCSCSTDEKDNFASILLFSFSLPELNLILIDKFSRKFEKSIM